MKNTRASHLILMALVLSIVGGALLYVGLHGSPEILIVAWPLLSLAALLGSTGLLAWAVEIGVRGAQSD
jgi:hypothetical protein